MNTMHNFKIQKQHAINQINEMQKRSTNTKLQPDFLQKSTPVLSKTTKNENQKPTFVLSNDTLVILGLILILSSENSDMLLLLALIYILM